jgi:hypothetical protein
MPKIATHWSSRCARTSTSARIGASRVRLPWHSSTLNDANEDHHNRDYQQNVDEPSHRVGSHEAEQPKNDQDNGNRLQQVVSPISTCGHRRDL